MAFQAGVDLIWLKIVCCMLQGLLDLQQEPRSWFAMLNGRIFSTL